MTTLESAQQASETASKLHQATLHKMYLKYLGEHWKTLNVDLCGFRGCNVTPEDLKTMELSRLHMQLFSAKYSLATQPTDKEIELKVRRIFKQIEKLHK